MNGHEKLIQKRFQLVEQLANNPSNKIKTIQLNLINGVLDQGSKTDNVNWDGVYENYYRLNFFPLMIELKV